MQPLEHISLSSRGTPIRDKLKLNSNLIGKLKA
jgi:hypothetical protein